MILIKLITSGVLLAAFLLFIWGSLQIFDRKGEGLPLRLKLISLFIVLSMLASVVILFNAPDLSYYSALSGLFIIVLGVLLFMYCYKWMNDQKQKRLTPVTSEDSPEFLFKNGPFAFIRHPFYSAYILVFLGGAVAANTMSSFLISGIIFILYTLSARAEEQKFLKGKLAEEYRSYKKETGMFFPKLILHTAA